ncbi:MAG: phasin family protein [Ottowia sp.]|nr:phasin family protein [Ottowia sp.]
MSDKSSDKRKSKKSTHAKAPAPDSTASMPDHNIWLAGLGALAQAQADAQVEGHKAFETLVKQGMEMQAQSQEIATRQWTEAAERLGAMTTQVAGGPPTWNRLGSIFEARVQSALVSLGLPSADDWSELNARLTRLEQAVAALQAPASASGPASAPRKTSGGNKAGSRPRTQPKAPGKRSEPESDPS